MTSRKKVSIAPVLPPVEEPLTLPRFSVLWRVFIYPACVLIPGGGLVLGLLYARQSEKSARNFGFICLGLALLGALARMSHDGGYGSFQGGDNFTRPFY